MFDLICIFTKSGVVVWFKSFCTAGLELVNVLIKDVLLEEKASLNQFVYQNYIFKWRLENQTGLVFAVIYQEVLQLMFVDEFMDMLRDDYMKVAYPKITFKDGLVTELPAYDDAANDVMQRWQKMRADVEHSSQMRTFGDTKRGQKIVEDHKKREDTDKKAIAKKKKKDEEERKAAEAKKAEEEQRAKEAEAKAEEEKKANAEAKARFNKHRKSPRSPQQKRKDEKDVDSEGSDSGEKKDEHKKKGKDMRTWGTVEKVTKKAMDELDHSKPTTETTAPTHQDYFAEDDKVMQNFRSDSEDALSDEDEAKPKKSEEKKKVAAKKEGLFARLTNRIKGITGNKTMTAEDLVPVMKEFRDNLVQKNVATEIADKICESVMTSLTTQKTATFTSVKATVKGALKEAIQRVLTPKVYCRPMVIPHRRNIDILKEAQNAKARGVPYTIVFIGVNGVGKSTSLAKVAYYLKTKVRSLLRF